MDEELRSSISQLRQALDAGAGSNGKTHVPEDVGLAVDDLRRTLWGALTTSVAADAEDYLVTMRIRRASEMLQDVLADLYIGGLSVRAPGTDELRQTTGELRAALAEVS